MSREPGIRLERFDDLAAVRDAWRALAPVTRNIFATWEWAHTWWSHFGRDGRLRAVLVSSGDRPVAVLPLYIHQKGPLRMLRFVGNGPADELGPVCPSNARDVAASALVSTLGEGGSDLFLGEQLAGDAGWPELLRARVIGRSASPVLRFAGSSWDEVLAARSRKLRHQVRRFERRLGEAHNLKYRLADDPVRLGEDLDTLFALHRARWPGSPWFGGAESFHRDFAAAALERGWLRLWLLELDGRPVAAWLGYRFGGVESYYQAGRDPAWERWSVGFVLLAHTIRSALEDGMTEYRFLAGGEHYKYRFATADPGLVTLARANGVLGSAALAARTMRGRLRALLG